MYAALAVVLSFVAHNPSPVPAPIKMEVTGRVREGSSGQGGGSQASLVLDDNSELILHGSSSHGDLELLRLAGARIKVNGVKGDPLLPRGNHLRVDEYQIIDVGAGAVPRVGRIATIELNGAARLLFVDDRGQADWLPASYNAKMTEHVGARVWMIGTKEKGELIPTRFAVLREAAKHP